MRITKQITVGDRTVTIRELTVADIRAWLKSLEAMEAEFDLVGATLLDNTSLDDLAIMTDLTPDALDASTPSEIRQVFDACREVNADFFALRGKLEAVGRAALANPVAT